MAGQLTSTQFGEAGGQLDYTYTTSGQVDHDDATGLTGAQNVTHGYDLAGRLSRENLLAITYDLAGNTTALASAGTLSYDNARQLTTSTSSAGNVDYTYDAVGQRTQRQPANGNTTQYAYDTAGNLTSLTTSGSTPIDYAYDGDGLRTDKVQGSDSLHYVWDQSAAVPLLLTENTTSYLYDPSGLPFEQIDSQDQVRYFHHDRLGSIRTVIDTDGQRVSDQTFDAHGNKTSSSGPAIAFGYTGEYNDPDSGLVYLRARYYDPQTGQFLTRDPLEATTNDPYGYANADPANNTDPTGLITLNGVLNGLPSLQGASDFAASFGDNLTLGATQKLRQAIGVDEAVNYCSVAYGNGPGPGSL